MKALYWLVPLLAVRLFLAVTLPLGFGFGGDELYHYAALMGDLAGPQITYFTLNPLYYFLLAPLGDFILFRIATALIGFASIVLIYFIVRELASERIALGSAVFAGILPTHIILSSTLCEDGLALCFSFAFAWFLIKAIKTFSFPAWLLGSACLTMAFLAKSTTYFLIVPFFVISIFLFMGSFKGRFLYGLIPVIFFFRLFAVEKILHVVRSFPLTGPSPLLVDPLTYSWALFVTFFLWASMLAQDNPLTSLAFAGFCIASFYALIGWAGSKKTLWDVWVFLFIIPALGYVLILQLFVLDWQGRYLYPALWAFAFLFVKGLGAWKNG